MAQAFEHVTNPDKGRGVTNPYRRRQMTKFQILSLLSADSLHATPITIKGITGLFQGIAREDGSGKRFNITLLTNYGVRTVHVCTID
jgi:hypothetical protein